MMACQGAGIARLGTASPGRGGVLPSFVGEASSAADGRVERLGCARGALLAIRVYDSLDFHARFGADSAVSASFSR